MSTIEKAAEKLAAGRRAGLGSIKPLEVAESDHTVERLDAHSSGRLRANSLRPGSSQLRFCDIDLDQLEERGFLRPGEGRTQLAREMRRIKRPLLMNFEKHKVLEEKGNLPEGTLPCNLVMITSSLPGEGKTFTAINLVMSLAAELDKRVLLVDADTLKGDISDQLGIATERGLADLLHEPNYFSEDAVLTSNIERLSILPAGHDTDHVDELFASDMMRTVALELADADPDRIIVFDAPPLLPTTEAAVLARHMGQIVLVVEADKTPQDAVSQAIAQLEGCQNVSLLLNKTSGRESGGYGYGYGYGRYGDGSRERDSVPERASEQSGESE